MADQTTGNGTPHIRTFAKDFAKLSGKNPAASPVPVIQKIVKQTVPPPPATTTDEGVTVKEQEPIAPPLREEKPPEPLVIPPASASAIEPSAPLAHPPDAAREAVLARLRATSTPSAQPAATPSREEILSRLRAKAAGEAVPQTAPSVAPIHTYKSDFAERVQETKASPLSVLAAEQDVSGRPKPRAVPVQKEDRRYYLIGAALILVAVVGTFAAYYFVYRTPLVPAVPTVPSLVFADERVEVFGTGSQLLSQIVEQMDDPLSSGQVRVLYVATSTRTDNGLLRSALPMGPLIATLPLQMPALLSRSIEAESTVGIMSVAGETRPFMILRVDSFERSFAGMLEWEPSMRGRLATFFPPHAAPTATTSPAEPPQSVFTDEVVANHDTRVLYDREGRVLMLYGYHDKRTLILARSKAAFGQLVERLSTTR